MDEKADGNITTIASSRLYALDDSFVQLKTDKPWFFKLEGIAGTDAEGTFLYEYPGGEDQLKKDVLKYTSDTGTPQWYYFNQNKVVGLYPIPDSADVYRYTYEKNVMVDSESDQLPFDSKQKAYAFTDMATRLFTFLFTRQPLDGIKEDVIYNGAKSALMALLRKKDPTPSYGYRYQ